jgi:hypothetical protein
MPTKAKTPQLKKPIRSLDAAIKDEARQWRGAQRWESFVIGKDKMGNNDVVCHIGYSQGPRGVGEVVTAVRTIMREYEDKKIQGRQIAVAINRKDLIRTQLFLLQFYLQHTKSLFARRLEAARRHSARIAKEQGIEIPPGRITPQGSVAANNEIWPEVKEMLMLWVSLAGTGAFMPFTEVWQNGLERANPVGMIDLFFDRIEGLLNETRWRNEALAGEIDERIEAALKTTKNIDHGPKERRYHTERGKGDKQHGVKLRSATEMGLVKPTGEEAENETENDF